MPKITKHGGPTVYLDSESFLDSLGESEPEVKEVTASVGDSLSKSSKPTQTIEEILKTVRR
jgi:hypothetical protein